MKDEYERYLAAEHDINEGLIRRKRPRRPRLEQRERWRLKMEQMASFLRDCGDPQAAFPAVHIAGTSGKGSVCVAIAEGLRAAGLKVGLHISPYLQSATEKIWIDGRFVSAVEFADLVDWVMPLALPWRRSETRGSPHGMASIAIAYEAFRRANVDVAVWEAGCGGRFDLGSFLRTEVAVVTSVALDHVKALGPELTDIAWHKAGIMRPGKPAVVCLEGAPLEVARREAAARGAPLIEVQRPEAPFMRQNLAIATAALRQAGQRLDLFAADSELPTEVAEAARRAVLPGRLEVLGDEPPVCLDGAHNPDKIGALVRALACHPVGERRPRVGLVGVLGHKNKRGMLRRLAPALDMLVASEPRVFGRRPMSAKRLAGLARRLRFGGLVEADDDPPSALDRALELAGPHGMVLVTGSLYLVGELRSRWYPKREVVLGRSSWPTTRM